VLGYGGEPYVRVNANGTVEENRLSPATFYNQTRYGGVVPSDVTTESALQQPAEWSGVGSDGTWAWHDHRAHLMSAEPLIGMEPGDQLAPEFIEILVDGEPVTVEVVTTLQAAPSRWPSVAGVLVGLATMGLVLIGALRNGPTAGLAVSAAVVAGSSVIVGVAQFVSLAPETDPLMTWWLLPTLALMASLGAVWVRSSLWRAALVALAGLQLLVWAVPRRHALTRAILPTDLPYWVDRAVTAAVIPAALALIAAGLLAMFVSPARHRLPS